MEIMWAAIVTRYYHVYSTIPGAGTGAKQGFLL